MSTVHSATAIRTANFADAKIMVRENLLNNNQWLIRGVLAIFARQTNDEQDAEGTKYDNKMGFNSSDAEILSSYAKQIKRWLDTPEHSRRYPCPLSVAQLALARRKMAKYSGQLVRIAQATQEPAMAA